MTKIIAALSVALVFLAGLLKLQRVKTQEAKRKTQSAQREAKVATSRAQAKTKASKKAKAKRAAVSGTRKHFESEQ